MRFSNFLEFLKFVHNVVRFDKEEPSDIRIEYNDPMVQYSTDYINYDMQSFIGEIGGFLGLTVGLSFYYICELFIDFFKYITGKL